LREEKHFRLHSSTSQMDKLHMKQQSTESKELDYDIIIIGGGLAGLTAADYSVRKGLSTVVFEKKVKWGCWIILVDVWWHQ